MAFSFSDELKLAQNKRETKDDLIEERFGHNPIVFCAPHARRFTRTDGRLKPGEPNTGELAIILAKLCGGACLIQNEGDRLTDMRERLKEGYDAYTLIDLHGMKDSHNIDVNIGVGANPSEEVKKLNEALKESFGSQSFGVAVNSPFPAIREITLTNYFQNLGRSAVQIEFARHIRDDMGKMEKICEAVHSACGHFLTRKPELEM